jgi:hypothetical protein
LAVVLVSGPHHPPAGKTAKENAFATLSRDECVIAGQAAQTANFSAAALAQGKQHYEISMFWKAHRGGLHI